MRLVHASFGLLIIIFSYFLFRLFFYPALAIGCALILGSNHSLVAISRMAMRDNSGLILEIISLGFLYYGLKVKKLSFVFIGSLIMGLSFYVYYSGRITVIIWFLFLVGCLFLKKISKQFFSRTFLVSLVGFFLIAAPIIIVSIQASFSTKLHYEKEQLLIFEEGRKLQKEWVGASFETEGVVKNITNGLTVFNNNASDYAWIYPNPKHGFVDPLTGILVWIGVIMAVYQPFVKRKIEDFDLLNLVGLFTLLFIFSFISNKAPNYTRLLVILPFTAYFVVKGITTTLGFLKTTNFVKNSMLICIIGLIIIWNLTIFYDFVQKGFREGNDVGGTARYVEARSKINGYKFYLSADNNYPYYGWGSEWQWKDWIGFFAKEDQIVEILPTSGFMNILSGPPFTIFMSRSLWIKSESEFLLYYSNFQIYQIKPDGSLVAIEVF